MTDLLTSPYDARSTAADVVAEHDLTGRRYLVTGGYAGLGLAACRALAAAGADLVVAGRDLTRAGGAAVDLRGLGPGTTEPLELDLADQASVDTAAERLGDTALAGIVANAGVMACPLRRTAEGWEWQLAVNVLGHVRLIWRLLPALARSEGWTRVVMLSSAAHHIAPLDVDDPHFHERGYDKWRAYGQSKTADSLFAVALQQAGLVEGLDSFAVHPGGILTDLQRHLPREEQVELGWVDEDGELVADGFRTTEQGAATQVWAATDPSLVGQGGRYLEDCAEAAPSTGRFRGVRDWAVDPAVAQELWRLCAAAHGFAPGG